MESKAMDMTTLPALRSRLYTSDAPWFELLRHKRIAELNRDLPGLVEQWKELPWPMGMLAAMRFSSEAMMVMRSSPPKPGGIVVTPSQMPEGERVRLINELSDIAELEVIRTH